MIRTIRMFLALTIAVGTGVGIASCSVDGSQSSLQDDDDDQTSGSGGSGGDGFDQGLGGIDSSNGGAGAGQNDGCAATSSEAEAVASPADIIIVVDTSGSMSAEAQWTQTSLPGFVAAITGSGVDAHVVLISNDDMCVPSPLGSGACGCPFGDESLPVYRHVCTGVGSNDALEKIIATYPFWKDSLRPGATKTFAVISDDDSDMSASTFTAQIGALDATLVGFKFDAIVSSAPPYDFNSSCFLLSAAEGTVYKQLVQQTGGVFGDLCSQNFGPVFQDMATAVVAGAQIACEYDIPAPPEGETLDPSKVNVEYRASANDPPQTIYNVANQAACDSNGGWYYDDPVTPTKIYLCQATCDMVHLSTEGRVDVLFGCETEIGPPA